MSMIDPTSSTASMSTGAGAQSSGLNQLDNSQTFLNLLVAQLKNQDPDDPTDPTSFMTELSQLTSVESQTSLSAEEQTVAADSMLGQTVTGSTATGSTMTGRVTGVLLSSSGPPSLSVTSSSGQTSQLALDAISEVSAAATAATATY